MAYVMRHFRRFSGQSSRRFFYTPHLRGGALLEPRTGKKFKDFYVVSSVLVSVPLIYPVSISYVLKPIKKTKEMVMGSCGTKMNMLMISSTAIERVSTYKLLGVVVGSNLKCEDHVSAITSKAARRIWFLKKLKRAGASVEDLAYYYQAVI